MRNIDKEEYFNISDNAKLPRRCPILNRCERRAFTLYISDKSNEGKTFDDFKLARLGKGQLKKPLILQKDDGATYAGGNSNWVLSKICPEVSLFEPEMVPFNPRGLAVTSGSYDKYYENSDKTVIHDCGHFSECLEFIAYSEQKKGNVVEDIFDVKPNWMGIGINFNALFRRYFKK